MELLRECEKLVDQLNRLLAGKDLLVGILAEAHPEEDQGPDSLVFAVVMWEGGSPQQSYLTTYVSLGEAHMVLVALNDFTQGFLWSP